MDSASILVMVDPDDRVLLLKRSPGTSYQNTWGFPGGFWSEGDDSLLQTALRECWEETGISIEGAEFLSSMYLNAESLSLHAYIVRVPSHVAVVLSGEHTDHQVRDVAQWLCHDDLTGSATRAILLKSREWIDPSILR